MAKIIYKTGDLLDAPEPVIVHGVNAQGRMGSGLAKFLRNRYPWAYDAYRSAYEKEGLRLGEVIWAVGIGKFVDGVKQKDRIVGNAVTQEHYGYDGQRYVDYDAIRKTIQNMAEFALQSQRGIIQIANVQPITEIAFPMIGSKLGGGDWNTISVIIEQESGDVFQPIVYQL